MRQEQEQIDITKTIREGVKRTGISQKELARRVGVTETSISRYVTGERIPRVITMARILDVFKEKSIQKLRHTEQIIDYIIDGDSLMYNDNHGTLIRCRECKYYHANMMSCPYFAGDVPADGHCFKAVKKETE